MTDLTEIPNIGPATAQALRAAGVADAETLRAMGAHNAYAAMLRAGTRPHFIWYYVLHMSLQGRPWNDCHGPEKTELRRRFDALVAEVRGGGELTPIEAALREIGLIARG